MSVLVLVLASAALNATPLLRGPGLQDWLTCAVYILVSAIVALRALCIAENRAAWASCAIGVGLYGAGNVLWAVWISHLKVVPTPSVCDGFWLALYPFGFVGIVMLARGRAGGKVPAGVGLDGLVAGIGLAALGCALVLGPFIHATGAGTMAMLTEAAYPVGDLLLAALVVGLLARSGWRIDRTWGLLLSGFLLLTISDCLYAQTIAAGGTSPTPLTNFSYLLALTPIALAPWQADGPTVAPRLGRWRILYVPGAFTLTALGLLLIDHVHRLNAPAFSLACLTLLVSLVRTGLTFREVSTLNEARRQAHTDDLTALPNRRLFRQRAADAIAEAERNGSEVAALLIDLDRFKEVNDTLGHGAGDALLSLIGPRLRAALRPGDVVARLGGDEFAILIEDPDVAHGATGVCDQLLDAMREPFDVDGLSLRVTASIGIATFPSDAHDAEELISRADVAMYLAKSQGCGYAAYSADRDPNSRERLLLAGQLAEALEHGGIEVHYQPQALTDSRRIIGAEALARWRRPDGALWAPGRFVDMAEQAGLSRALTAEVLRQAVGWVRRWRAAGHDIHVAVNTTVADLLDDGFAVRVRNLLDASDVPPQALILEVTERSLLTDPVRIAANLHRLDELGIRLSLDDFGTGFSSLTHLKQLPVSELKIDRSFVSSMCSEEADAAIICAIVELAHQLGIRAVAEGVEDEATWGQLTQLGCEIVQGYALGRPEPAEALTARLRANRDANAVDDDAVGAAA
jgi:diguanylate cyclase (GGDEF)-like protein